VQEQNLRSYGFLTVEGMIVITVNKVVVNKPTADVVCLLYPQKLLELHSNFGQAVAAAQVKHVVTVVPLPLEAWEVAMLLEQ
jgi:hypothetical protein